jgi:hypothetical protein
MDIPKSSKEYFTWAAFKAIAPNFIKPDTSNVDDQSEQYEKQAEQALIAAIKMVSAWGAVTGVTLPQLQQAVEKSGTPVFGVRYGFPRD